MPRQNQTMHTDLYQLTMMYGYYRAGTHKREAVFDLFFHRSLWCNHVITAGLEQAIEYIQNSFFPGGFDHLASLKLLVLIFSTSAGFHLTGDILAMPRCRCFPHEPLFGSRPNLPRAINRNGFARNDRTSKPTATKAPE